MEKEERHVSQKIGFILTFSTRLSIGIATQRLQCADLNERSRPSAFNVYFVAEQAGGKCNYRLSGGGNGSGGGDALAHAGRASNPRLCL